MNAIIESILLLSDHQFVGRIAHVVGSGGEAAGGLSPAATEALLNLAEIGVERAAELVVILS